MTIRIQFSLVRNVAHTVGGYSGDRNLNDEIKADAVLLRAGLVGADGISIKPADVEQAKAVLRLNGFEIEESE